MNAFTLWLRRIGCSWLIRLGFAPSILTDMRDELSASQWARVRAPLRHRDLELSDKAIRWLRRMPAEARPVRLCQEFPRIVNRIAALWQDEGLSEYTFDDLLNDTRGGRLGFPPAIVEELTMLYELHLKRMEAPKEAEPWRLSTSG